MRRALLMAAACAIASVQLASAADMPTKAPVYAPIAMYNWTGFYIGGHIGGGWADERSTELAPGTVSFPVGTVFAAHNLSGFLGGVQGGFNWQASNNFVLGVEGDYSWEDLKGTATTVSIVNGFTSTTTAKSADLALLTGRLGYAMSNWLFYVKGGGAWKRGNSNGTGSPPLERFSIRHHQAQVGVDGSSAVASNGDLPRTGRLRLNTITSTSDRPMFRS